MADFSLLMSTARTTRKALEFNIDERVQVKGYESLGTVRYYGPHLSKTKRIIYGIELDEPEGDNDGSVYQKRYFACKPGHGILVVPTQVKSPTGNSPASARRPFKKGKKKVKKQKSKLSQVTPKIESDDVIHEDFEGFDDGNDVLPDDAKNDEEGFGSEDGFGDDDNFDNEGGDEEFEDGFDGFGEDEEDMYQDVQAFDKIDSQEIIVVAKFDFNGEEDEDLPFKQGEELRAKDIGDEEWWRAKNSKGAEGMIPMDFVTMKGIAKS